MIAFVKRVFLENNMHIHELLNANERVILSLQRELMTVQLPQAIARVISTPAAVASTSLELPKGHLLQEFFSALDSTF